MSENGQTQALAPLSPAAASLASSLNMDADRLALASRTLGGGLRPDELHLFLAVAARQQLDPMSRQIYAWKDGGKLTIHISIDGRRAIAHRTGLVDGTQGPFWCGKDGVWREVWTEAEEPVAAKFEVFKKGASKSFPATALMKTYKRNTGRWLTDPVGMLAKVSEDHAWRRAFPYEMGGLPSYRPENDQATEDAAAGSLSDGTHEGEYREVHETSASPAGSDRSEPSPQGEDARQAAENTAEGVAAMFAEPPPERSPAERTDDLWKQYRGMVEAAQGQGIAVAEMRPSVGDVVLRDEIGKLQRKLTAKSTAG